MYIRSCVIVTPYTIWAALNTSNTPTHFNLYDLEMPNLSTTKTVTHI